MKGKEYDDFLTCTLKIQRVLLRNACRRLYKNFKLQNYFKYIEYTIFIVLKKKKTYSLLLKWSFIKDVGILSYLYIITRLN